MFNSAQAGGLGHGHMYFNTSYNYNWILTIASTETTIISHVLGMESSNSGSENYDRTSLCSETLREEERQDFSEFEDEHAQDKSLALVLERIKDKSKTNCTQTNFSGRGMV